MVVTDIPNQFSNERHIYLYDSCRQNFGMRTRPATEKLHQFSPLKLPTRILQATARPAPSTTPSHIHSSHLPIANCRSLATNSRQA